MSGLERPPSVVGPAEGWDLLWRSRPGGHGLTQRFGKQLAEHVEPGDVILLEGPLGAGKTFMTRAICDGLGIVDGVSSPSYALVHTYPGPALSVAHVDLYRLERSDDELESIGFRDLLDGRTLVIVEWPDRAPWLAEVATMHVFFEDVGPDSRRLTLSVPAPHVAMLAPLRHALLGTQ